MVLPGTLAQNMPVTYFKLLQAKLALFCGNKAIPIIRPKRRIPSLRMGFSFESVWLGLDEQALFVLILLMLVNIVHQSDKIHS